MLGTKRIPTLAIAGAMALLLPTVARALPTKRAPIMTRWASQVSRTAPWPEYPRPQLVRADWLNLNGVWEYQSGAQDDPLPTGKKLSGQILVPFPVESALSGVMEHHDRLWYRRQFAVPTTWKNKRIRLNFDAVDYEAEVFVNGKRVGMHQGGYLPFSYDVTPYLKPGGGPQELIVRVYDPTDAEGKPRGKQSIHPGGIMYTPTTGIWQTVWLEPVAKTAVRDLKMVPDIDRKQVTITVDAPGAAPGTGAVVTVSAAGKVVRRVTAKPNTALTVPIPKPKLWSPSTPFLYDVEVKLTQRGAVADQVRSYFGMRKIALVKQNGVPKLFLNNRFVFELGPLDQGFWPDGIYTPPTEAALKNDIQMMKRYGFNMVRKHIKVEPARWYYWTDRLGLLVWQDMPSPNSYLPGNVPPPPVDKAAFESQLRGIVTSHWNHPSIIMWVIFNEGQGQYDTERLVGIAKRLDPSRVVNQASGWQPAGVGDVLDVHSYPAPNVPQPSRTQALACGEYGGIGLFVPGHTWTKRGDSYVMIADKRSVEELYAEFAYLLQGFRDKNGLSAAVYTQLTDVENELNGLMTYDRVFKVDPAAIALANRFQYPLPTYRPVVPTSEKTSAVWRYTTATPAAGWNEKRFDDSAWQQGKGGFGGDVPNHGLIGTAWTTPDIWLRRTFTLGNLTAAQINRLMIRDYHDEDVQVFVNGVPAYSAGGFTTSYEYRPLSPEARRSLVPNGINTIAVHCRQTAGGQYIDAGLYERIPSK